MVWPIRILLLSALPLATLERAASVRQCGAGLASI